MRFLSGLLLLSVSLTAATLHEDYSPAKAFSYTQQVVGFGERMPGSPGHAATEVLIRSVVTRAGGKIDLDSFTATTPRGNVEVHNIIGKFNVSSDPQQKIFILAGHYDTLFQPGFLGANDGGSSTAILLAFADALATNKTKIQIWLVWTDLEEAVKNFDDKDGLYGSRHLAAKLAADKTAARVKGFFLLDMIGDKDLSIARETGSERWLQDFISQAAKQLGYSQYFFQYEAGIVDDHVPFIQAHIPSVDVVDANYGRMGPAFDGMGEFHHAKTDTMAHVSQKSLEIVGRTILLTVELLDR